jgi:hypothetical protein
LITFRIRSRLVAVALLAVGMMSERADAAEFRVLDFNASCAEIPALEAARGTRVLDERLPSGFQYAFRDRELDRDVVVAYACRDGKFYRGAYIFAVPDEATASAVYRALKQRVTRELGQPSYDFASAEYRKKMQDAGATLSRADTQVAFWEGKHSEAHASVAEPSGERGWRVSLSYTAHGAEDR